MQQPTRFDPSPLPPIERRRCPKCGLQMFLSYIAPSDHVDCEERTYECLGCDYEQTVRVKFRHAASVRLS